MKAAIAFAALLVVASFTPAVASAQQFTSTSGSILNIGSDAGDLLVRWTETSVQPDKNGFVWYSILGTKQATYYCTKVPSTPRCTPDPITGQLLLFGLSAQTGGTIRQTAGVDEPDPVAGCGCSADEGRLVLYKVTYGANKGAADMLICDITSASDPCVSIGSGYFTQTFCKPSNLKNCPPPS